MHHDRIEIHMEILYYMYLSVWFIVNVCEHFLVGHEVCPEGGASGIQGQPMPLLVAVTQECTEPTYTEQAQCMAGPKQDSCSVIHS